MGRMVSHVPELLEKRGWGPTDLFRAITKLDEKIGRDTCYRLYEGDTNVTTRTIELLCQVFDVPIQKVMEFKKDEQPG